MLVIMGTLAVLLLYLEMIYHISGFGWSAWNPVYTIALIVAWSGIGTLIVGVLKGRIQKIVYYFFVWLAIIWACVQYVYYSIFKQPLLWEAIFRGGEDALTNYWRESLNGVLAAIPFLALMVLPGIVLGVTFHIIKWEFPTFGQLDYLRVAVIIVLGIAGEIVVMQIGKSIEADFYEEYAEFFDPHTVAEEMGFLPTLQRDTLTGPLQLMEKLFDSEEGPQSAERPSISGSDSGALASGAAEDIGNENGESAGVGQDTVSGNISSDGQGESTSAGDANQSLQMEQPPTIAPQQFAIDFAALHALADNAHQTWLADYIESLQPTTTNEYTGMFEGYNLIFLTAEGFSSYAVREDLTPTLHRLVNSGFVFDNYYVPLWQTSTSDGEYINCTGLIPDGQFSMRESGDNGMEYVLPKFFAAEGVNSYAYHNNSLTYYDRYITHPNLGYNFKSCKLGEASGPEWEAQIFPMENPGAWPASDLEMMQGTVSEYVNEERFHVYYMTVSGHMNYNFKGNAMAYKNRDAVADVELSENARAYLACNIELDKALEYLLEQLAAAGQLEKTVICLNADHYPYGMSQEEYEELAGNPLSEGMDLYRNSLILWNAGMEEEPVHVEKVCGSMDILPTLLNLFGFEYDSRMYAGRDIFSDEEGLVIFKDRSFVTDSLVYIRKGKEATWLKDVEDKETYLSDLQKEVKDRYQFSAYVLQEDYYRDVEQAIAGSETLQ